MLNGLLILAEHELGQPHLFGWYLGFAIAFAVIVVVVIVVAAILSLANRIGKQAREGILILEQAQNTTLPLWEIRHTNSTVESLTATFRSARRVLEGEQQ